jgi:NADH-quinone oxidoreductase subunit N
MSAVSLYYYLRVLKQIYVRDAATTSPPLHTPYLAKSTIGLIALLVAVLGLCPNLLLGWIDAALTAMPH